MRSVLALGLLIALCAPAGAAKVRHAKPPQVLAPPASLGVAPGLTEQERKRLHDINIPSYNDPSKFGGA